MKLIILLLDMIIKGLIKDVSDICISHLNENERIYYEGEIEWSKFDKNYVCIIAAVYGWLDLLIWARKNNSQAEWDSATCSFAARNGHLEVLKWLKINGCPWDSNTCSYAAYEGHLEVLKWARQNGCPWDSRTCIYAATNEHLEVLNWLKDNGCVCGGEYHKN